MAQRSCTKFNEVLQNAKMFDALLESTHFQSLRFSFEVYYLSVSWSANFLMKNIV